jgi:ribosomal protein S18 acetylase RimI-like enzyme
MWIEDIYIKESCRGAGIGSKSIDYIGEKYPDAILRLEVEEENERAVNVYKKNGFSFLPYLEMKK